jgi:predicted ATP-grasp superfamily ATP-dependent carboligase
MTRVLIAGVSTRAAAESAAHAGFDVDALDGFGDLDQAASVHALSVTRDFGMRFTAHAAARASRTIDCDAVAYLSTFDNHPRAVARLAAGRALWGNTPEVLRRVRDPFLLASVLQRHGFVVPRVSPPPSPIGFGETGSPFSDAGGEPGFEWLVKPLRSGGGVGVHPWRRDRPLRRGRYLQEFIGGIPASIAFVAARGQVVPLGVSRQLVGGEAFGASGYRYCGNILSGEGDAEIDPVVNAACELARVVAQEFQLTGVNGIDFIVRGRVPYAIEVNPRWSSSMELVERAYGISVFGLHAVACVSGDLPAFDLAHARSKVGGAIGKAIVFARDTRTVRDPRRWLTDATVRDVPHPGESIAAGRPICTVFASGSDAAGCESSLAARASGHLRGVGRRQMTSRCVENA